jgi:hypothetical protein
MLVIYDELRSMLKVERGSITDPRNKTDVKYVSEEANLIMYMCNRIYQIFLAQNVFTFCLVLIPLYLLCRD